MPRPEVERTEWGLEPQVSKRRANSRDRPDHARVAAHVTAVTRWYGDAILVVADFDGSEPAGPARQARHGHFGAPGSGGMPSAARAISRDPDPASHAERRTHSTVGKEQRVRSTAMATAARAPIRRRILVVGETLNLTGINPLKIGFMLDAPDNDSFMLGGDMPHPACPECGFKTNPEWIDPSFRPTRTRYDASYTYDGYLIISEAFRAVVAGPGVVCVPLPSAPGFYSVVVQDMVPFDSVRYGTEFEDWCDECRRFTTVAGATPVFLKVSEPLEDKLFRTDVEFGTGDEQHPCVIMGAGLAQRLRDARFAGPALLPVTGLAQE